MGFAVHVPHYLARAEYPQAARVLVDHLGVAAGLYLPTEALTMAAERAEREIDEQVAASEEVEQVVEALERQYDAVTAGRASGLSDELPSADELAAEVERFLAARTRTTRRAPSVPRRKSATYLDGPPHVGCVAGTAEYARYEAWTSASPTHAWIRRYTNGFPAEDARSSARSCRAPAARRSGPAPPPPSPTGGGPRSAGRARPSARCGTSSSHCPAVAGPGEREGTPADADDVDVVEQQPVDLHRRDLARGEADHEQPPERARGSAASR